jgi:YidC/Oxa1 family membrane protein insertase
MNNNKNVLLAIALAAAVLFVWQYFVATPAMKAEQARQAALSHQEKPKSGASTPALPGIASTAPQMSRETALKAGGTRIVIDTPMVDGSILLKGARLDDLRLKKYRDTVDPKSPEIVLLAPKGTDYPYYATFGWVGGAAMPDDTSEWRQTNGNTLSPGHPVTLTWDNGHGLVFTRVIAIDDKYMFTVTDSVANKGGAPDHALSLWHGGTAGHRERRGQSIPACRLYRRRQWRSGRHIQ